MAEAMFKRKANWILNESQKAAKNKLIEKLQSGEYKEEENVCLCGGSKGDVLLADEERYGIPFRTVICKSCGLVRANPYYTADTINRFYNEEYPPIYRLQDSCDEEFWNKRVKRGEEITNQVENRTGNFKGKMVYEIGCGSGATLFCFKERGAEVVGCDLRENYAEFGNNKGIEILVGDYRVLKTREKADIVILNHVLEHLQNPLESLRGMRDLMNEGCVFYIGVPFLSQIEKGVYEYDLFRYLQNSHMWYFSENTLVNILQCAGYEILEIKEAEYIMCTPAEGKEAKPMMQCAEEYEKTVQQLRSWENVLDKIVELKEKNRILRERNDELHEKYLTMATERKALVAEKNGLLEDRKQLRAEKKALQEECNRLKERR